MGSTSVWKHCRASKAVEKPRVSVEGTWGGGEKRGAWGFFLFEVMEIVWNEQSWSHSFVSSRLREPAEVYTHIYIYLLITYAFIPVE